MEGFYCYIGVLFKGEEGFYYYIGVLFKGEEGFILFKRNDFI